MMKKIFAAAAAGLFTLGLTLTSFAGTWERDTNGWKWIKDNGNYAVNEWCYIDTNNDNNYGDSYGGEAYYFGEDGYMYADRTAPNGCYLNADGALERNGKVMRYRIYNNPYVNEEFYKEVRDDVFVKLANADLSQGRITIDSDVIYAWSENFEKRVYFVAGDLAFRCAELTGRDYNCKFESIPDELGLYEINGTSMMKVNRNSHARFILIPHEEN